jgi:nucleotide-binding universal stress UspA family protein
LAPVCARRNRGESREKNEVTLYSESILLATDGSKEAELAAGVAVELARSSGAELHLVHVKLLPIIPPYPEVLDWRGDLERADRGPGSYSMSKSRRWRRLAAQLPGST